MNRQAQRCKVELRRARKVMREIAGTNIASLICHSNNENRRYGFCSRQKPVFGDKKRQF